VYTHLHGECQGVDDDEDEDAVLETTRRDEPPDLVLKPHAWNVAPLWLHLQRELDTLPLYTHRRMGQLSLASLPGYHNHQILYWNRTRGI